MLCEPELIPCCCCRWVPYTTMKDLAAAFAKWKGDTQDEKVRRHKIKSVLTKMARRGLLGAWNTW